jgi:hypothetical protein
MVNDDMGVLEMRIKALAEIYRMIEKKRGVLGRLVDGRNCLNVPATTTDEP